MQLLSFQEFLVEKKTNPCWQGYKQVGLKKKGGKMVPNCVKIQESTPPPPPHGENRKS